MNLKSAYRVPYDPFPVLARVPMDGDVALNELWENLIHQGYVDSASYAAVPKLVSLGELYLVAAIEVARKDTSNPSIAEDLESCYFQALNSALFVKPKNQQQYLGYYIIHASINEQHDLAKALSFVCVDEILSEYQ